MKFYHGSSILNIEVLQPSQADHDKPYVYLTTNEAVAALYICNPMRKPYYWFPYGFENNSPVPIYHEIYPDALKDVSLGKSGCIYETEVDENALSPLPGNPFAMISAVSVPVQKSKIIDNAYDLFVDYIKQGKMQIRYFHEKSDKQLDWWYSNLVTYLKQKNMIAAPDCAYAVFIKKRLPQVWERYISSI